VEACWDAVVAGHVRLLDYVLAVATAVGDELAWQLLEERVRDKRLAWWAGIDPDRLGPGSPVELAHRLLYFDYLELDPDDGEVVERTERRIVTRWRNPCPVLEACDRLGLDTREVCRRAYERPCEDLLRRLDPRLRFRRSYETIRPHAAWCEETIELVG